MSVMNLDEHETFKVGDCVTVTDRDHLHHGERGVIVRPFTSAITPDLDWIMRDGAGDEWCVGSGEVKRV